MHEITLQLDVPATMRDGTILRANVFRPEGEGPFPVLLARHPYDKNLMETGQLDVRTLVRAGYIVVTQDSRGRFTSDGEWQPLLHERDDGYDTVEWAASLSGSNGRVGMFGPSYLGSTQWSAAIARPPHLATIVPATTFADPDNGLLFRGGAIEFGNNLFWGLFTALGQIPKAGLEADAMMRQLGRTFSELDALASRTYWQLPAGAPAALAATGQPDLGVTRALADPATMEDIRVSSKYDDIDVPTLGFAGWYDLFLQGDIDNYVGLRARGRTARLVIGPWHHGSLSSPWNGGQVGEINFGLSAQTPGGQTVTDIEREWYDHWLKDMPATHAHEPGVLIFVMGTNQWRSEEDWPLARAKDTALYLNEDKTLTWSVPELDVAGSGFTYDPADPVITRGGSIQMASDFPAGPFDQRIVEARDDVLVFTTDPLETDLEITGRIRATIFASTDGPSTDWVVRVCEVNSAGVSRNITDGITRVHTESERVDEVDVDLWSTSIVIRAGHRLRVQVTSSNFPRWDRNLNTGEPVTEGTTIRVAQQRLYHDRKRPSRIILPIVPSGPENGMANHEEL
jgi:putative CocE/NonD family hydrolase